MSQVSGTLPSLYTNYKGGKKTKPAPKAKAQ